MGSLDGTCHFSSGRDEREGWREWGTGHTFHLVTEKKDG